MKFNHEETEVENIVQNKFEINNETTIFSVATHVKRW